MADPLVLNVVELLRRPSSRKAYHIVVPAAGLTLGGDASVPDGTPVDVDVVVESLTDGLTVNGEVRTTWVGTCRRCLGVAAGDLVADVEELYQVTPTTEDAFAFDGEQLDLRPMVRELALMELPQAPVCRADCAGICPTCGADRNVEPCDCDPTPIDPRWSALDQLRGAVGPAPDENG